MLSLVTCTGGRRESFLLLERWIREQDYKQPYEWIVVDDCRPRTPLTMGQVSIHNPVTWTPGSAPSMNSNLLLGLQRAQGTHILFIEDDECYGREYLKHMTELLEYGELAGMSPARYYNLFYRHYRVLANLQHASLCQTAVRRSLVPWLEQYLATAPTPFVDLALWRTHRTNYILEAHSTDVLSMKGLPGRAGIGAGHRPPRAAWTPDPDGRWLEGEIGTDRAQLYAALLESTRAPGADPSVPPGHM